MIECISISIYDTTVPAIRPIPENFAEKGSCKLYYDGGDTKLVNLMASRLEFAMEVDYSQSLNSLFYDHLFTGNETKFKTIVRDQDDNTLWEGFLLPDEYSEPFTTGTFFIDLTATDGLARLKGKKFSDAWYRARHSYTKILADCLKKTGLALDIYLSPAIENVAPNAGRWDSIFIDGASWGDETSKADCYEILEAVLKETACTLFQQNGRWYVEGYNRRSKNPASYYHIDADGVYVSDVANAVLSTTYNDWNASPQITLKPPYKEVIVNSGVSDVNPLFPEDIVVQPWTKTSDTDEFPLPKYWKGTGITPILGSMIASPIPEYDGEDLQVQSFISAAGIYEEANDAQVYNNYISFKNPVYVKGGNGEKLSIKITLSTVYADTFFDDPPTVDTLVYDILLGGTSIISNRKNFTSRDNYLPDFDKTEISSTFGKATSTLVIEDYRLKQSGFLDVRIHHPYSKYTGQPVQIEVLEINYIDQQQKTFSKRRDIDFTQTETLDIKHGDSVLDKVKNNFIYQPVIPEAEFTEVPFGQTYAYDGDNNPLGWGLLVANETDYLRVITQPTKIYLQRIDSDFPEYVQSVRWINAGQYYIFLDLPDGHIVRTGDRLLVRESGAAGDPQTATLHNYREQWRKTTHQRHAQRFGYILSEMIHDNYPTGLVMFEGTTAGLVFPLSLTGYEVGEGFRRWIPLRLELIFGENETRATFIEFKNEKVRDYEA
ncbi:MAG: hypothetical protein CMC13_00200 [Flavobacteriaceae bacterium]|nr:hypothetical protein [Flavobacteriaceae bacterium]|tara:strand:- start:5403 stop:7553 length:2151 start_codon:yes stop_codon:yes gene_type:complete